jgi:plastocyanin
VKITHLIFVITGALALGVATGHTPTASFAADAASSSSGVLKGIVKLEGTAPKPMRIDMSDDPKCAKLHPGGVTYSDIVTDGHGGLENVVVFVSDGLGDRIFDPPQTPAVIEQRGCMYEPHVLAMQSNQKLDVVNADTTTHNIHPSPKNNREWNKSQPPGVPIEETFARAEVAIPVKCNVHPWMRGYIAVFKHPYFALTSKDGSFEIRNLPPGTYTIEAWHEKLGAATQKITVGTSETIVLDFSLKELPGSD